MADEPKADPKYLAVYHSDHEGEPIALIRTDLPGNHATEMIRAMRMAGGRVEAVPTNSASMHKSEAMADLFAAGPPVPALPGSAVPDPDEPGSTADPDATLRAEIRTRLETEERTKRIEGEVRKEMAADRREAKE